MNVGVTFVEIRVARSDIIHICKHIQVAGESILILSIAIQNPKDIFNLIHGLI
jgi:hypothetical protein